MWPICPQQQSTVPAITFNYAQWVTMFPEFGAVEEGTAQGFFDRATLFCKNKLGPVPDISTLTTLLYLVTSHIAQLNAPQVNGQPGTTAGNQPAPNLVGRIQSATEGSVSVVTDYQVQPGSEKWFAQTRYGAEYWTASMAYRTFRYHIGHIRNFDPWPIG